MSKKNEAWDLLLSALSPEARAALTRTEPSPLAGKVVTPDEDDDSVAFNKFVAQLSPEARQAFLRKPAGTPEPKVEDANARWGVVESTDGEWAQMRLFKTADALVRRVSQLEGTDTVVWCFYGIALQVTKGPQRYLSLPGGTQLIQVPLFEGGPAKVVDADLLGNLVFEEAGYVGPPELAESHPVTPDKVPATAGGDDDDD